MQRSNTSLWRGNAMQVRYLQPILSPEEFAGPFGAKRDVPDGPWLKKAITHGYVEPVDLLLDEMSREDLIAEVKRLRDEIGNRRLIDEAKRLIADVRSLEEPSNIAQQRLDALNETKRLLGEIVWQLQEPIEPEPATVTLTEIPPADYDLAAGRYPANGDTED